jgi:hypothetical protein
MIALSEIFDWYLSSKRRVRILKSGPVAKDADLARKSSLDNTIDAISDFHPHGNRM